MIKTSKVHNLFPCTVNEAALISVWFITQFRHEKSFTVEALKEKEFYMLTSFTVNAATPKGGIQVWRSRSVLDTTYL